MEADPRSGSIVLQLLFILFLVLVNAFFAAAEMAIVSLNKNKIKVLAQDGNKKAKMLESFLDQPTHFLSTIQVGITFAGLLSSASAAISLTHRFSAFLENLKIPYASNIALLVITLLLSYITLVFGELLPKRIALYYSEKVAMFSVIPILFVSKITTPFVKILSFSTNLFLKMFNLKTEGLEEKMSKEEIKSLVEVGKEHGVINETEREMINSIISFDNKVAKEVMTSRKDVFAIDIDSSPEEYLGDMLENMYSRVPVYKDEIDNIVGILYLKDFFSQAYKVGFKNVDVNKIMQQPYFIPERKNIDVLFKDLQATKRHIAILVDEYGGFSGIVTIEDLIEEVMGDIEDEFDNDTPDIIKIKNNEYIIKGITTIHDLNEELHLSIDPDSDDYETIGGFVINHIGYIPEKSPKEDFMVDEFIFRILEVKDNRIEKIKMIINTDKEEPIGIIM